MSEYLPRGAPTVNLLSVNGWRAATDSVGDFTAAELQRLSRPLDFEGGPLKPPRNGLRMQDAYTLTFDVSAHQVPTPDNHRDYRVEPYLYVTDPRTIAAYRPNAYDPVPSADDRYADKPRLVRIRPGAIYSAAFNDDVVTITIAPGQTLPVVRLLGRIVADRWYFAECDFDT